MAKIEIKASGFAQNYAAVNGNAKYDPSMLALWRCMITVGMQNRPQSFSHGISSLFYHVSSCFLTSAMVKTSGGNLCMSELFHAMDSSEKGAISYRLGMGLSKYVAEVKLGIPWLMHVDQLRRQGVLTLQQGALERGDLAGPDLAGDWHVIEAKGRSNTPEKSLLTKSKSQASRVIAINGTAPATKCASIIHLAETPILCEFVDPDIDVLHPVKFEISEKDFISEYYAPILKLARQDFQKEISVSGMEFKVLPLTFGSYTLGVGISERIMKDTDNSISTAKELHTIKSELEGEKFSIGLDGIIVIDMTEAVQMVKSV